MEIGKALSDRLKRQREAKKLETEQAEFKLAPRDGLLYVVKIAVLILLGVYNAKLFLATVPGWLGYATAIVALSNEAVAFWCVQNYPRSTGKHKTALLVFACLLGGFSIIHASISYFGLASHAGLSGGIQFYAERVAFPLLMVLLSAAAVIIPLLHWQSRVAAKRAESDIQIAEERADVATEMASLQNQNVLELARLNFIKEQNKLRSEFVDELEITAGTVSRQQQALNRITDPDVRRQVAAMFDLKAGSSPPSDEDENPGVSRGKLREVR